MIGHKILFSIILILFISLILFLFLREPRDEIKKPVIIRLVVPSAVGDPLTEKDEELARRFNSRVNGEYRIQVFPGESLAKIPEYFDAVRVGAIEMADAPWGVYAGLDPRLSLIETPFLFNNIEAGTAAAKRLLPLHDRILQERFNAKALGLMHLSGMEVLSSRPITILEDWKGLMVGAISPAMAILIKELGGSPVTIMWTDLYTSLQKGIIDGTVNGTHGSIENGLMDVCTDVSYFFGSSGWNGFTINLDLWKRMPPDIQQILLEEVDRAVDWIHNRFARWEVEDLESFQKRGLNIHIISNNEREKWCQRLRTYQEKQFSSMSEFGIKVKEIVDEVNSKHPYHVKTIEGV
ncbi:MAG: TRAP transporter substrate-binding protein DctP [Deltaproteobacteria bacterium]|nr:TRAP transporter substrate-binding protein DctP [Deltaproteobacteria bacterium]